MKPSSRPPRTPAKLSDSLHHRLNMYALAASAAGVGTLALSQSAEAKVVYTPAHKWLPLNYYYIDLNHDGVNDFRFGLWSNSYNPGFARRLGVSYAADSQSQNEIYSCDSQGFWLCAAALPAGQEVGPRSPGFRSRLHRAVMFSVFSNPDCSSYWNNGPWLNVKGQAYLGVRFAIKGRVHYGWVRLGHISHDKPIRALLMGYAYETIPNKAIITGKEHGTDDDASAATLGRLALGANARTAQQEKEPTLSTH